jgi:general secretion pathway protein I
MTTRRQVRRRNHRETAGFTLIEVLVALAIVAIALVAGLQATTALTNNALRSADVLQAQLCAENELVRIRLARLFPDVGENTVVCEQAGRPLQVLLTVRPTPNPQFRRVDAQVSDSGTPLLQLATIVTRF